MRKSIISFIAAALMLAACGGSTAESVESDAAPVDAETTTTVAETTTTEAETTTTVDEAMEDDAMEEDDGETVTASSIDDIPEVCRELMAEFLKDIEPIVSPVDWDNATMADFETISAEFEERSDQFDADTGAEAECENIELEDEENFQLLIDFAGEEAPGTVGFLSFVSDLLAGFESALSPDAAGADFETCDEAIVFVQGLVDQYDTMAEVPVAELSAITGLATVMFSCTPEQLEFFDSPEINEFFGDF